MKLKGRVELGVGRVSVFSETHRVRVSGAFLIPGLVSSVFLICLTDLGRFSKEKI